VTARSSKDGGKVSVPLFLTDAMPEHMRRVLAPKVVDGSQHRPHQLAIPAFLKDAEKDAEDAYYERSRRLETAYLGDVSNLSGGGSSGRLGRRCAAHDRATVQ